MLTIRPATEADAPRLAELSATLGYPIPPAAMVGRLRRISARPEDVVLVAELAPSGVVGWIHGAERDTLESEQRCEILGLVVDSAHRTRGIGRQLVTALEQWARARGLEEMAVRSNVTRIESHPFYERLGYRRVKTSHIYRKLVPQSGAE